jgi:hypothetical protein
MAFLERRTPRWQLAVSKTGRANGLSKRPRHAVGRVGKSTLRTRGITHSPLSSGP